LTRPRAAVPRRFEPTDRRQANGHCRRILGEAAQLAQLIETVIQAIDTTDFDRRLQQLEAMPARAY
jgi:hypothetical protein